MPGSYLIDVPRRIVFTRGWGALTDADVTAHAETLRADRRFDPAFRQIVDFREVREIRVTSAGVQHVAANNPFRPEARRGFVVALDQAFEMLHMFGLYTEADATQFGIFRALEPAMEWVGLDPATPWPSQAPDATFGKQ
jgi:hypothetical protein